MAVIGIGVDAVDVGRFRTVLARTPSMRTRLFTDDELVYVSSRVDQVPSLAARFAAREAVMKALGLGLGAFGFHDVSVHADTTRAPRLLVGGRAAELATEHAVDRWHLSLSHDGPMAIAVVVAESSADR